MTITVTQSTEKEIEVTLPLISQSYPCYYHVTEKELIIVERGDHETSIRKFRRESCLYNGKVKNAVEGEPITEKDFNKAYRLALIKLHPDYLKYEELEDKVHDMFNEDDTQNGMIRIGEWVSNFLGHGAPMVKYRSGADYEADKRQDRVETAQAYKDHSEGQE